MALTQLKTSGIADDAVTTDKLANAINTERTANTAKVSLGADSVTGAKIADDAIDSEHITDGSIDNAHLADDAVGVAELSATGTASSSTFLRGDNSWAAVTSTTINNNGNKKVIIGTSTANTLEADSNLFVANGKLSIGNVVPSGQISNNSLDVKGDETNAYIDLGDPFPTFSSGQFPTARLKTVDANKTLELQSMYGGDNQLYKHIELSGHNTIFYEGNDNNTEIARITTDGLTFNGDTATANALDDYEEGTWTPTATQGVDSISGASCRYVKIGNVCTVSGSFSPAGNSSSSAVIFSGLPYTSHSSHAGSTSVMHDGFDEDGSAEPTVHVYVGGSSTNFYVYYSRTAGVGFQNATGEQVHSHQMIFNITYPTA